MRRALVGVATAAALVLAVIPSIALANTRVDGNHFSASGVRLFAKGCFNPDTQPTAPPRLRIKAGPQKVPLGSRSAGWIMANTGYGIGPTVHVAEPSTVTINQISLFAPTGYAQGQAVVAYHPTGDTGVWRGTSTLPARTGIRGWQTVDANSASFNWIHYDADGVAGETVSAAQLRAFVAQHGGDGDGAEVGFIFGCDGSKFFVDSLKVGNASKVKTYDFEGFKTTSTLSAKSGDKRLTIVHGDKVGLVATVRRVLGGDNGRGALIVQSKVPGAKSFSHVARKQLKDGRSATSIQPTRTTVFRARFSGSEADQASTSDALTVRVRVAVKASMLDSKIVKGRPFTIVGRTLPGKANSLIRLQRYTSGKWSTVRRGLTGRDGSYRIGTVLGKPGRSYWRVTAAKSSGNESGKSRWLRLEVVSPPSAPPPTTPPSDPPPPPPIEH